MDKCEASAQIARRRLVLLRQQLGGYQDDKPLDLVVYYVPSTHRKVWGRGVPSGRSLLSQNPTKGGESFIIRRSPHTRQRSHRVSMAHALGEGG